MARKSKTEETKAQTEETSALAVSTRKQKIIHISYQFVLNSLSGMVAESVLTSDVIRIPEPLGLPATARVVSIQSEQSGLTLAMIVEDESFDPVPEDKDLPELVITWSTRELSFDIMGKQRRDKEWVDAMTEALGQFGGFTTPDQPDASQLKELFKSVRDSA